MDANLSGRLYSQNTAPIEVYRGGYIAFALTMGEGFIILYVVADWPTFNIEIACFLRYVN